MSDAPIKVLEARIAAMIERIRDLAAERNALLDEVGALGARLEAVESSVARARNGDLERLERENTRLRAALEGAVRELREESAP